MELLCVPKVLHGEREGESILFASRRATIGHGNAQATSAPQLAPPFDIRLKSGDIVVEFEGDADVALEVL
jgi:hypothetical protein